MEHRKLFKLGCISSSNNKKAPKIFGQLCKTSSEVLTSNTLHVYSSNNESRLEFEGRNLCKKGDVPTTNNKETSHIDGQVCKTSSKVLMPNIHPVFPFDNKSGLGMEDRNFYKTGDILPSDRKKAPHIVGQVAKLLERS